MTLSDRDFQPRNNQVFSSQQIISNLPCHQSLKMKSSSSLTCGFLILSLITMTIISQSDARSIRTKRESTAMLLFNRSRRELWDTYNRLLIIYERMRLANSVKYIPTTVEGAGRITNGIEALTMIRSVMGREFPIVIENIRSSFEDAHRRYMNNKIAESFTIPKDHRSEMSEQEDIYNFSNSNNLKDDSNTPKFNSGSGLVLKVITGSVTQGNRRTNFRALQEIVHLCGKINRELVTKSVRLKCVVGGDTIQQ